MMIKAASPEAMVSIGAALGRVARASSVVVLCGDLGAGKTQLSKGVAAGLGIDEPITSPTFNIVLEYHEGRLPLYHFDLYRLEEPDELEDIDIYALFEAGGISLVEWGDKFPEALPEDCLFVTITIDAELVRTIDVRAGGPESLGMLEAWQEVLSC